MENFEPFGGDNDSADGSADGNESGSSSSDEPTPAPASAPAPSSADPAPAAPAKSSGEADPFGSGVQEGDWGAFDAIDTSAPSDSAFADGFDDEAFDGFDNFR